MNKIDNALMCRRTENASKKAASERIIAFNAHSPHRHTHAPAASAANVRISLSEIHKYIKIMHESEYSSHYIEFYK